MRKRNRSSLTGRIERGAFLFPVRDQLGERPRVHHRAGEDVRADLGAFFQHADRAFRRALLQADRGGESRGAAADDDDVVLHRFAGHAANYNQRPMADRKLVHTERIDIRWGDMDAMGHVNNTVYFRYMEQARIGWFESLVPRGEAWRSMGIVIVNASCNFKKPINYPGTRGGEGVRRRAGRLERADLLRIARRRRALRRRRRHGGVRRPRKAEADAHSRARALAACNEPALDAVARAGGEDRARALHEARRPVELRRAASLVDRAQRGFLGCWSGISAQVRGEPGGERRGRCDPHAGREVVSAGKAQLRRKRVAQPRFRGRHRVLGRGSDQAKAQPQEPAMPWSRASPGR